MQQLKFLCVTQDNAQLCADFSALMFPYSEELDEDLDEKLPAEILQKWIDSILQMQGDSDRHLELCYDGDALIGFLYGKVDHPEHRGYIKPGYGYIMEFYVRPEFRRKGYGTKLYRRFPSLSHHGDQNRNPVLEGDGFLSHRRDLPGEQIRDLRKRNPPVKVFSITPFESFPRSRSGSFRSFL